MKHLQTLQNNVEVIYQKRLSKLNISKNELLLSKIVLLDTELSEYMNEIEDHKLYKINKKSDKTKALEELSDCIHVICSIANMLSLKLDNLDFYKQAKTDNVMLTYKKAKYRINTINIERALKDEEYIEYALSSILLDIIAIANAKNVTETDMITAFVAVYTKNMIRAKGNY